MSGGSYNYLCYKDIEQIQESGMDDIKEMQERLVELDALDVAKETEQLILDIKAFQVRTQAKLDRLSKVWYAVEWFDSADSGIEHFQDELNKYRNPKK